jgi:hypothetical protein
MISEKLLRRISCEIRKKHRAVLGVGIGFRQKNGRLTRALSLKLYVREKPKKGQRKPKGYKRLPPYWPVAIGKGARPLKLLLPTDVEELFQITPTDSFSVGPMTAGCWVRWQTTAGADVMGIITAGHGLPALGQTVPIDGHPDGTVVLRSDYRKDGIDIGLVSVNAQPPDMQQIGPANLPVGSASSLIAILGNSTSDNLVTRGELWTDSGAEDIRAVAFVVEYPVGYKDAQGNDRLAKLKDVLIADGPVDRFAKGKSGATWVVYRPSQQPGAPPQVNMLAAAIQCFGRQPDFDVGIGTHLDSALKWIGAHQQIKNLRWWWST